MNKFSPNSTLEEVLSAKEGEEILNKHNVPCLTCPMAAAESGCLTLQIISEAYGLDLEAILKDLNN